jgi:hypothetical protein
MYIKLDVEGEICHLCLIIHDLYFSLFLLLTQSSPLYFHILRNYFLSQIYVSAKKITRKKLTLLELFNFALGIVRLSHDAHPKWQAFVHL